MLVLFNRAEKVIVPIASGAVALAKMVATDPRTCAAIRVNATWILVRVWRKIMPKPTPWIVSNSPSQSHNERLTSADATGPPAHGRCRPMDEVLQSI